MNPRPSATPPARRHAVARERLRREDAPGDGHGFLIIFYIRMSATIGKWGVGGGGGGWGCCNTELIGYRIYSDLKLGWRCVMPRGLGWASYCTRQTM